MSTSKTIVLKSSDGETFEVEEAVAVESQTIKHMIEDNCADTSIPLPNVTSKILAKVIEYCKRHVESAAKSEDKAVDDELKTFDSDFVNVDQAVLFDLILVRPSVFDLVAYLSVYGLIFTLCVSLLLLTPRIRVLFDSY